MRISRAFQFVGRLSVVLTILMVLDGVASVLEAAPVPQEPAPVAQGVVVPGGVSPDKRWEIRVFESQSSTPTNYVIAVVDAVNRRVVKKIEPSGGYYSYASIKQHAEGRDQTQLVRALWHVSGRFVAITDFGLKTSNMLYVFEVTGENVVAIGLPDYEQNALGRVDATATNGSATTELRNWDGDVLKAYFTFRVSRSTTQPQFAVSFSLRLVHGPGNASRVTLESMEKPAELPCCELRLAQLRLRIDESGSARREARSWVSVHSHTRQ